MENFNFSLASMFTVGIPFLFLLISIFHITKKISAESVLLVTGSALSFITSLILIFLPYYIANRYMPMEEATVYYSANGVITFLGHFIFAVGFLMLVTASHKSRKLVQNN